MDRPDESFLAESRLLETAYLDSDDPIEQSGFSGGRERWVAERSPLVEAISTDGTFLDVGCAVGLLAHDVVGWASARGFTIEPYGIDIGERLIDVAKDRVPEYEENFHVADAWQWRPNRQWTYVYSLLDLSPSHLHYEWLCRLSGWVEPGGRLIIGSYGSRSRNIDPVDVDNEMTRHGFDVEASISGGNPLVTRFAWTTPL